MIRVFGIKNCDTMKKAFTWCEEHGIPYEFHDYKKLAVPRDRLMTWCKTVGWETLINTRGPTFRKLPPRRQVLATEDEAIALMVEFPSLIKRPVVETAGGRLLVGFDASRFESVLK